MSCPNITDCLDVKSVIEGHFKVDGVSNGRVIVNAGSHDIAELVPEVVKDPTRIGYPTMYPGFPDLEYDVVPVEVSVYLIENVWLVDLMDANEADFKTRFTFTLDILALNEFTDTIY